MPDSSSPRRLRRLPEILVVVALLAGGTFFWANWGHSQSDHASSPEALAAFGQEGPQGNSVRPQRASAAQRAEAIKTIRGQLHAFDIGDWEGAVAFQSEGLKGSFASPEQFGQMIQRSYPAFVGARRVDFGDAFACGSLLRMNVQLTARDGQKARAQYTLNEENGQYHVATVMGGALMSPEHHRQPAENKERPEKSDDSGGIVV